MKNPIETYTELIVPDPLKGGDAAFRLRYDFEEIAHAEDLTGRPLLTGLTRRDVNQPSISLVRAMLFAALLPTQPQITLEEASAFVTRKTLKPIWERILIAWAAAMEEPEETAAVPIAGQSSPTNSAGSVSGVTQDTTSA